MVQWLTVSILFTLFGSTEGIARCLMSQNMQNYKRKPPAGLVQTSVFGFWNAMMYCVVLYCLQEFPELILEGTAYFIQNEFVFLLNYADV